jgi:phosphoribosylanthranilate isomerase
MCGMKYPDNILEVDSLYQIIWDLSLGKNHRGILMVSSLLYQSSIKNGVLLMKPHLLLSKVLKHDLQVVQLHGKESVAFVELRNQLPKGIEIIKSFLYKMNLTLAH